MDKEFGLIELGSSLSDLPAEALPECLEGPKSECEVLSHYGIYYGRTDWVGPGIYVKYLNAHSWNAETLPWGLTKFDRIKDVVKKLRPRWKSRIKAVRDDMNDEIIIRSGVCFTNTLGIPFEVRITFLESGQINDIYIYSDYPGYLGSGSYN